MTAAIATKPRTPVRLVVIEPKGVSVYEDRKMLAFSLSEFAYDAEEIEEMRLDNYDAPKDSK